MELLQQVKGQVSVEYLLIIALSFAVLIPATYVFYNYSSDSTQEIVDSQVIQLGNSIVDSAETIYFSGKGSKTILEFNTPENIDTVSIIDGKELIFNITSSFGTTELVFFSDVNITTLPAYCVLSLVPPKSDCRLVGLEGEGLSKIKIEAQTQNSILIEII
jgi:uncharacterized protein (UPF0333 family)